MKPSFVFVTLALLVVVPASALAFRPAPGDQLAQSVQLRALRMGDRGEQVAELQRLLRERGFDPGPVDAVFGPLTRRAVWAAQDRYSLVVDGLAGRLTVGALRNSAVAVTTVNGTDSQSGGQAGQLVIYQALTDQVNRLRLTQQGAPPVTAQFALTFNGLPDEPDLDRILEALGAREVQATFFVSGEEAETQPGLLERIHKAGHEVSSLGYTALDMRQLSPLTARALIRRTQLAIREATGRTPAYFRPPLGRFDSQLTQLVESEGLTMVLWSNVTVIPVPEMEAERLADELGNTLFPGAVLMLPLDRPNALAAVEPLLARLEGGGYLSRTLSDLTVRGAGR